MKHRGLAVHAAIWFGAAAAVFEIEAGIAAGGNWKAVLLGRLVGGVLLFAAGLIGARTGQNAMETTGSAFGIRGSRLFAALNLIQLVGWTAVMVSQGAKMVSTLSGADVSWVMLGFAALVTIWLYRGLWENSRLLVVVMSVSAALAVFTTFRMTAMPRTVALPETDFWQVFEMSVAMSLSWLPLISDYTSKSSRPVACTLVSTVVYTAAGCWMGSLGMVLAKCGISGLAEGFVQAGISGVGIVVVVLSTVVGTLLDTYSAGESATVIGLDFPQKEASAVVCIVGAAMALAGVIDLYSNFLCIIASVFAPMTAVLLTSRYLVRNSRPVWNFVAWEAGALTYQMAGASPIGPTLTAILVSAVLTLCFSLRKVVPPHQS